MPKVTRYARDPLKGLILEQKEIQHLNVDDVARMAFISKATYYRYMKMHTSLWLTEAFRLCITLGLSVDEIRPSITYCKGGIRK